MEAMLASRPYRDSKKLSEALKEIQEQAGILYDADVVNACITVFKKRKFSFENVDN